MTSCISSAAEAHADRMWDAKCEEEELFEYLDKRGITAAEYEAECNRAAEDAAADAFFWSQA